MIQSIRCITIAVFALIPLSTSGLMAGFVPPSGLAPGSQYEILFVTAGTTAATSSEISDYNRFVNAQAAFNPLLPSTNWNAIVSTPTVNAKDNAPYTTNMPIYDTLGQRISDGTLNFYNSGVSDVGAVTYDQFGNGISLTNNLLYKSLSGTDSFNNWVWTGSTPVGTTGSSPLGTGDRNGDKAAANVGAPYSGSGFGTPIWIDNTGDFLYAQHPVYALSDPITVPSVPEPTTLALLSLGGIGLLITSYRRRQKQPSAIVVTDNPT